ncbi:MAG: class I SAM-dependent methyltransferase [Proteobacteria bacterium]|nr:class I SAM-dependent methyltransferase [Pseudomonadota bacterium]MCZ6783350.1 class I SAM-dependent methyltransferase [Pseudomonadota bacterium]
MSLAEIEAYWTERARQHRGAPAASWSDVHVMDLEVEALAARLRDGERVLDVGCANGYSTVRLAARRHLQMRGLDYVPEMIEAARERVAEIRDSLAGSVEFAVGNVLDLQEPADHYDAVILVRVLINLRTWENQRQALEACVRALRPGGKLLFSEATLQGLARLNALRGRLGLDPIPAPDFNEYLDEERVGEFLAGKLERVECVDFASTYYVGTRVLKPLVVRLGLSGMDVGNPHSRWNRFFARLPAWGDYGTQKLFVYRRPGPA